MQNHIRKVFHTLHNIPLSLQYPLKLSATQETLAAQLLGQMDNNISTATDETEDSLTPLTASEGFSASCESKEISMPAYHGSEHSDILLHSPIGQCSVKTTSTGSMMGSTPSASVESDSSMSITLGAKPKCQEGLVKSKSHSFSSEKLFMYLHLLM